MEKRREYNSDISFCSYEKAVDEVRRPLLFSILQERNILNLLLTAVIKIYEDKIKIKLDDILTHTIKINVGLGKGYPFHHC